jgi:glycosyltransferase involved in cell wall biosynthesis
MKIHVYTTVRNEKYMIEYFLRHYRDIADEIFVWDDESTDGTREILNGAPNVHVFTPTVHGIDNQYFSDLFSEEYRKRSRGVADWVMVVDVDEFIYQGDLRGYLRYLRTECSMPFIFAQGWNMISEEPPYGDYQIYDQVRTGVLDRMYNRAIFDPNLDIRIGIGNHEYYIMNDGAYLPIPQYEQDVRLTGIKCLHMRYLGEEFVKERHKNQFSRLTERNKANGWGVHSSPDWNGNYSLQWYKEALKRRVACLD